MKRYSGEPWLKGEVVAVYTGELDCGHQADGYGACFALAPLNSSIKVVRGMTMISFAQEFLFFSQS